MSLGEDVGDADVNMNDVGSNESKLSCSPIYTLQGHKRSISSLAISPDGLELASCSADGQIKIWTLATGTLRATLDATEVSELASKATSKGISDVAWSRDGRYLVCGGDDKVVRVWDAKRHTLLCELEGHTSYVFCVSFNPDVSMTVSGGFDETVRMWDLQRSK